MERKSELRQWTLVGLRSLLHKWFVWLRENRYAPVDADKLPRVGVPNEDDVERRHLTPEEVAKLYECVRSRYRADRNCQSAGDLLLFGLLFGCGLRISEAAAIRVGELDYLNRQLWLPKSKGNKMRYVAVPGSVCGIARLYLRHRRAQSPEACLFLSIRHERYASETLARRVHKLANAAGVAGVTSHCGRRFCLTILAEDNVVNAQKQAGHANIQTTQKYLPPNDIRGVKRAMRLRDPLRSKR
jgi:integrase/recombinase XerC